MLTMLRYLFSLLIFANLGTVLSAKLKRVKSGTNHKLHDDVHLVVNKVGPFNNPAETYRYYSLPFCQEHDTTDDLKKPSREAALRHKQKLGEAMVGDRRESSPYEINFYDNVDWRQLCKVNLQPEDIKKYQTAIENSYYFEMYVEDLPLWGYVGDVKEIDPIIEQYSGSSSIYLFTHLKFIFGVNDNKIVSALVTTDKRKALDITDSSKPLEAQFTYSVKFIDSKLEWKDRMSSYTHSYFARGFEIHWLSIVNSFVLVLLLVSFLAVIMMRILKNDFSRYMEIDEETVNEEESGWKLIHGDVFRFPHHTSLFCAAFGAGVHLIACSFIVLFLALTGVISTTKRGSILSGVVICYCLTSFIGGYVSTQLYFKMNGKLWVRVLLLNSLLFPFPVVTVFSWVNSVALANKSTSAITVGAGFTVALLFLFVSFPLTIVGGLMAKNYGNADFNAPTRTTKVAREIPFEDSRILIRISEFLVAGILPFTAIYIELHYIFASMWGHHIYTLFGVLLFAFVLLLIVTSAVSISLLYFRLTREDHQWWWISFFNGGATGITIYLYSLWYYYKVSEMSGLLQGSFFFGYMLIVSLAFFLMAGSSGFYSSLLFVKYIYSRVKCD